MPFRGAQIRNWSVYLWCVGSAGVCWPYGTAFTHVTGLVSGAAASASQLRGHSPFGERYRPVAARRSIKRPRSIPRCADPVLLIAPSARRFCWPSWPSACGECRYPWASRIHDTGDHCDEMCWSRRLDQEHQRSLVTLGVGFIYGVSCWWCWNPRHAHRHPGDAAHKGRYSGTLALYADVYYMGPQK